MQSWNNAIFAHMNVLFVFFGGVFRFWPIRTAHASVSLELIGSPCPSRRFSPALFRATNPLQHQPVQKCVDMLRNNPFYCEPPAKPEGVSTKTTESVISSAPAAAAAASESGLPRISLGDPPQDETPETPLVPCAFKRGKPLKPMPFTVHILKRDKNGIISKCDCTRKHMVFGETYRYAASSHGVLPARIRVVSAALLQAFTGCRSRAGAPSSLKCTTHILAFRLHHATRCSCISAQIFRPAQILHLWIQ